jgi:putative transposase
MKTDDQEQARLERARAIGLFRYMLIREAADPALTSRQRGALVRQIAAREHADPSGVDDHEIPSGRPVAIT